MLDRSRQLHNNLKGLLNNMFIILFQGDSKRVDFDYFRSMALEYFRSNDPAAVGNYINGKLDFNDDVTGSM